MLFQGPFIRARAGEPRSKERKPFSRRLTLNLTQSLLSSLCFFVYIRQDVRHAASSLGHFYQVLLGEELADSLGKRVKTITTPQALAASLDGLRTSFFELPQRSLTQYNVLDPAVLELRVLWRNRTETRFFVTRHDKIERYLSKLEGGVGYADLDRLSVRVRVLDHLNGRRRAHWPSCYMWDLQPTYEERGSGELRLSLRWSVRDCLAHEVVRNTRFLPLDSAGRRSEHYKPPAWMMALLSSVLGLAIIALFVEGSYILMFRRKSQVAAQQAQQRATSSYGGALTAAAKNFGVGGLDASMRTGSGRELTLGAILLGAFASVVQAFAVSQCMHLFEGTSVRQRLSCLGFACALSYLNLVPYLSLFDRWHVMIMTLRRSIPRCLRFGAGVAPVYLGYVVLGVALFGISDQDGFRSLSHSSATLFSLVNGDAVRDTFLNLGDVHWLFAQAYLYSFMCLFVYAILNVILAIVEESFSFTMFGGHANTERSAHGHSSAKVDDSMMVDLLTPSGVRARSPRPVARSLEARSSLNAGAVSLDTRRKLERLQELRNQIATLELECSQICESLLS
eukprot:TRINITY_DN36994_c0_g1_i1.p1 TRINITY_DN36994_c0_g1~~TRINITY_DN36994_c0_g1_i1.p1  ORF type:complete len:566 (-),score=66.85 TRINITY_DN36994_c0_g1_i1:42-1739(-)